MVSQREAIEKFIKEDGIPESEFTRESGHCLHPKFLQKQLDDTLERLNLECLDVYYLQNVYEAQGPFNTDNVIMDRIKAAFEFMEEKVAEGKIKSYGMATYSCFRTKPTEHKIHLNL